MKKLFPVLVGLTLLGACKKSEDTPQPTGPSKTDLLTAKKWRLTAETSTITGNGQTLTSDDYANMDPCDQDNFFKFSTNNTAVMDEGPTMCSTSNAQVSSGSWTFSNNETKLTLSFSLGNGVSYTQNADIIELTATTMRLRYTDNSFVPYVSVRDATFTAF